MFLRRPSEIFAVRAGTGRHEPVWGGTGQYGSVQGGTGRYGSEVVQGPGRYRAVQGGTGRYRAVRARSAEPFTSALGRYAGPAEQDEQDEQDEEILQLPQQKPFTPSL